MESKKKTWGYYLIIFAAVLIIFNYANKKPYYSSVYSSRSEEYLDQIRTDIRFIADYIEKKS